MATHEPTSADRWVTVAEAARLLDADRRSVSKWAREGKFRYRDDLGREMRIWLPDLIPTAGVSHGSWCSDDEPAGAVA